VPGGSSIAWLRLHLGDRVLNKSEDAVEVNGEGIPPLIVRHGLDRFVIGRPHTVVGDEDIQPAEPLNSRAHQCRCGAHTRKVAFQSDATILAALADQPLGLGFRLPVIESNVGASSHEHPHSCRTDTTRSPGDQGHPVGQRK